MRERKMANWAVAMRALCVLALVLVAFAHRPLDLVPAQAIAAAQAFPDGTQPSLCLPQDDDGHSRHAQHLAPCDACRIAASVAMPTVPDLFAAAFERNVPAPSMPQPLLLAAGAAWSPSAPPQAPPAA